MTQIAVYCGAGYATEQDQASAKKAAEKVLGGNALEAYKAYQEQHAADIDEAEMTGLAALFVEATKAADQALTEGWHNPDADWCRLEVY